MCEHDQAVKAMKDIIDSHHDYNHKDMPIFTIFVAPNGSINVSAQKGISEEMIKQICRVVLDVKAKIVFPGREN